MYPRKWARLIVFSMQKEKIHFSYIMHYGSAPNSDETYMTPQYTNLSKQPRLVIFYQLPRAIVMIRPTVT